jgi:hypothetical protein
VPVSVFYWLVDYWSLIDYCKASKFIELIQAKLKESKIQRLQERANRIDPIDILRPLRIMTLKEKGNTIFVNVSVGKIQAIASMMAWDVQGYCHDQTLLCCS